MTGFSPAETAALDRVTVPAMRPGFARDVLAAANVAAPRRSARGGWRRHGRVLLGVGALVVASATAAATGLLDKLPIRIPGITHVAEAPAPKPHHVARVEKPRPAPAAPVALATVPVAAATPFLSPQEQWRERRAARIAAGLPVQPTLMQRALAAKLRALPPGQRAAAIAEWRRIKALPPAERKAAVAKVRADFLATHPKAAARYEARLEAKSAAAAAGPDDASPPPAVPQANPLAAGPRQPNAVTPEQRAERRRRFEAMTPEQREQFRAWRAQRRAQRLSTEGSPAPVR